MSGLRQSTDPAFAAWAGTLATVVAVDVSLSGSARRGRRNGPPPGGLPGGRGRNGGLRAYGPWIALILAAATWEALGIDTGRRTPHLTISALALAFRSLDAALFFVWVIAGLGFGLARARARPAPQPVPSARAARAEAAPDRTGRSHGAGAAVIAVASSRQLALLLPASKAAGVAFWIAWLAAWFLLDAAARLSGHRFADAERLLVSVSRPLAARVVLIGAWAYAGWHLFAH